MADRDRNSETSIIGRDADAPTGERVADQRSQTIRRASGTNEPEECEGLDIVFEREEPEATTH
jgi:hypothetical protein